MVTVDAFLEHFSPAMQKVARRARALVLDVVPNAIEHVYPGWRLLGYRVPHGGKSTRYFAFVAPYDDEVRLGFEHGVHLDDPRGLLRGDGTQVRYISLRAIGDVTRDLRSYIEQAVSLARLPKDLLAGSRPEL